MNFKWIGKSADGKTVTLNRLEDHHFICTPCTNSDLVRIGTVIDVETTGLSHANDQVIEIGVRQFQFNRETGELVALGSSYSSFSRSRSSD